MSIVYFVVFLLFISPSLQVRCPNACNGQGLCMNGSSGICECFPGFHGVDCSIRLCPSGKAWYDFPFSSTIAHVDFTECSNMGYCDRTTGLCECREGFTGAACDRILCPLGSIPIPSYNGDFRRLPCSGNGRCISLREVAVLQDYIHYYDSLIYTNWDADMIYGCDCDSNWEGFDCSKRSCPKGDDPMTSGVNEVQLIDCTCSVCSGGIYITFKNQKTAWIPYNATAAVIAYRLNQLSTIEKVSVKNLYGTILCSPTGSVTEVTFLLPQGDNPAMIITTSGGLDASLNVVTDGDYSSIISSIYSVTGTREYVTCSNHGICHNDTGQCHCFDGFESSDGFGNVGTRGDCGYRKHIDVVYFTSNITFVNTSCPIVYDVVCSGHGTCVESTASCTCDSGYSGPACSNMTCPYTLSWFGDIGSNHSTLSECGGVGECDGTTGICFNCGGNWGYYNGSGCEYISCPVSDEDAMCSGHGVCLTLREMGLLHYNSYKNVDPIYYTSPWDADAVRGCLCERAISIDNQYPLTGYSFLDYYSYVLFNGSAKNDNYTLYNDSYLSRYYRGPYAYAATDFKGYDCTHMGCPTGDDPLTTGQFNEIQMIQFSSSFDSSDFTLTFRGNKTFPIYCNQSLEELQLRLENLYTISKVSVTRSGNESSSLCDATSTAAIYVEFLTEFGNIPLMTSDPSINITIHQQCTKEDLECSAQGICSETTGICQCRSGFSSSNGTNVCIGEKGDCTFLNPLYTVLYNNEEEENEILRPIPPKTAKFGNARIKSIF